MNTKGLILTGMLALLVWLASRGKAQAAPVDVDNQPITQGYGNVYVTNELSPIQMPAPNPIYQSYYMTSPGIPDVKVSFNIIGADLDWGYIPLFGLLPEYRA